MIKLILKIFKYIFTFIIIIIFTGFLFLFFRLSFVWETDSYKLINSMEVPNKNYKFELYYSSTSSSTTTECFILRKTYNYFGYSEVIEVLDDDYSYYWDMKLESNNKVLIMFKADGTPAKIDSVFVRI